MSTDNTYFRYYDERFGDIYEVYTDHEGNFVSAARSLDQIGRDPIYYEDVDEIPQPHRNAIEQQLWKRQEFYRKQQRSQR